MTLIDSILEDKGNLSNGNLSLIMATVWIISTEYNRNPIAPLTVGQYSNSTLIDWYHNDLMSAVLKQAMNFEVNKNKEIIKFIIENRKGNQIESVNDLNAIKIRWLFAYEEKFKAIWFINDIDAFYRLEKDLLSLDHHYHRNGHFLLIYTGKKEEILFQMETIFRRLFNAYVINVNIMVYTERGAVTYTYFPYNKDYCRSTTPQIYWSFQGISDSENFTIPGDFFANKLKNMNRCQIAVTTWAYDPYILIEKNESTGELIRLHGLEGSLLSLIAEKMNFSILIKEPPTKDRGYVFANGSATGAIKVMIEGESNITIVCYKYDWVRSVFMLPTYIYMSTPMLMAIPPGVPISPFDRLTRPFRYILWLCFSLTLLFSVVIIFGIKFMRKPHWSAFVFGHGNRVPFSTFWETLYGIPMSQQLPTRTFARYILLLWMFYTFVLRNAYTAELYILLQDGRATSSLKTLRQVIEKNFTIYASQAIKIVLLDITKTAKIELIDESVLSELLDRLQTGKYRIAVPLLTPTVSVYNHHNPQQRLRVLPQKLITVPITMYLRKHSYLEHEINEMITNIMSSGLMTKYYEQYVDTKKDQKINEPNELTVDMLLGVFTLYAVLMAGCGVIFLMELGASKSKTLKHIMDFINF